MTEGVEILKQDSRGRVRVPVERREALLDEFERSGMSAAAFSSLVGVKYQTFSCWWRKRQRRRGGEEGGLRGGEVRWLEAVVGHEPQEVREGGLIIDLPGGARMQIAGRSQAMLAAELLRALGERRC